MTCDICKRKLVDVLRDKCDRKDCWLDWSPVDPLRGGVAHVSPGYVRKK